MSIASLDLNLAFVLHTVLAERNVARAAERLHVTPSAVSNALARLRTTLGDPLVTRKGRGIVPTPRALELAPALARAMTELESALGGAPFEAATCTRTFCVAVADAGQVTWGPRLARALGEAMPLAHLRIIGIESLVSLGDLGSAEVDVHLGIRSNGPGVHAVTLVREAVALVAARGHRAHGKRLSAAALGALRHVRVEMVPGKGFRDPMAPLYARAGIAREVAITVPTFAAALAIVASTDLVATVPASLLAAQGAAFGVRALRTALPAHEVEIAMCWHERTHADPAAQAFRALVRGSLARGRPSAAVVRRG